MVKYKLVKSRNEIEVCSINKPDSYISYLTFWFYIGSRYEKEGYYGSIHLLEHMLLHCYTDNDMKLRDILKKVGADYYLATYQDCFYLTVNCDDSDIKIVARAVMHALENANIDNLSLIQEKEVIVNEINTRDIVIEKKIFTLINERIWDKPLGHCITGNVDTLHNLRTKDVKDIIKYIYSNKLFSVIYVGKRDNNYITNCINQLYVEKDKVKCDRVLYNRSETCASIISRDESKNTIGYSYASMAYAISSKLNKKESLCVSLLGIILAANDSGRLYEKFRIKYRLVYFIMAMPQNFKHESIFLINFVSKNKNINHIFRGIDKQVNLIKNGNLQEDELVNGKKFLKNIIMKNSDDIKSMITFIGRLLTNKDKEKSLDETIFMIDDIEKSDIEKLIKEKFPKEYSQIIFKK